MCPRDLKKESRCFFFLPQQPQETSNRANLIGLNLATGGKTQLGPSTSKDTKKVSCQTGFLKLDTKRQKGQFFFKDVFVAWGAYGFFN